MQNNTVKPFLKWAGGKRWFVSSHSELLNFKYDRYIEPFLGAGAVFFHLRPKVALLGDSNKELIESYESIRNAWKKVQALLAVHQEFHSQDYYYQIRDEVPKTKYARAARFIYLNRTCWNGLYRVNLKGAFNVPIGTKNRVLLPDDDFGAVSKLLRNAQLFNSDFEVLIDKATKGDLLFLDPPYTVNHNHNGFIKYNEKIFSWNDQERLYAAALRAKKRGAIVIVTNANHDSIDNLYAEGFEKYEVNRASVISGKAEARDRFQELVMVGR